MVLRFYNFYTLFLDFGINRITDLPASVFTSLKNLRVLLLYINKLTTINSNSFGFNNQLNEVYLQSNNINAIDPKFIDNTAVSYLNMNDNICCQSEIELRSEIKKYLIKCFENFQPHSQPQQQFLPIPPVPSLGLKSPPKLQIQQQSQNVSSFTNQLTTPRQVHKIHCGQQVTGHGNIIGGAHVNRGDFPW